MSDSSPDDALGLTESQLDDLLDQLLERAKERQGTTPEDASQSFSRRSLLAGFAGTVGLSTLAESGTAGSEHSSERSVEEQLPSSRAETSSSSPLSDREFDGITVVTQTDHVQPKIDEAGVNGILFFEKGTYYISESIVPQNGQTWITSQGVEFRPARDTVVLDVTETNDCVFGPLHVSDIDQNSKRELIKFERCRRNFFERISLTRPFNGLLFTGEGAHAPRENIFGSIYMREVRNEGMLVTGMTHDNHFNSIWIKGYPSSSNGVRWETVAPEDGGNMINQIICISMGGDGLTIRNLNREFWIGMGIFDSCGRNGFSIFPSQDTNRALFVDSLWASGNGDNGVLLNGTSDTGIKGLQLGKVYTTGNTNFGGLLNGHVRDFQINQWSTWDNNNGLRIANSGTKRGAINHVLSYDNNQNGVDAPGDVSDVHIGLEQVDDGLDTAAFTTIGGNGVRAVGAGNAPPASDYREGQTVENTDDQTLWIKSGGRMFQIQ